MNDCDKEYRLDRIEEAFLLFAMLLAGNPDDTSDDERLILQERLAGLMKEMSGREIRKASGTHAAAGKEKGSE